MTNPLRRSRPSVLACLLVVGAMVGGVRAFAMPTPWTAHIEANGLIDGEPASVLGSIFGIADGATDGFDLNVDFLAPPPPPRLSLL